MVPHGNTNLSWNRPCTQLLSWWEAGTWKPAEKQIFRYPAPFLQICIPMSKVCATLPFALQSPSPLSSLHISSTFFILLSAPEDVFSSPLKKKSAPPKCNPGGRFTFCLTPYPISCSLNLWTLNIIHLPTPTHTWWLRADSFTKKDVSFSPLQHNAGSIPISEVL